MQPYGYKRAYRLDNETVHANHAESRKQAPKGCDSARRKTARQEARSVIKAATLH
jgi:hypothetical protein